jgi:chromosome transmission fidelity protein 1
MKICGYFASREASADADIIVTPYQTILSESARNSLGISLFNKTLVFDEAHNIMETISSLNSVRLSYA